MTGERPAHLSDDEFVGFVLEDGPPDAAVDRHLEGCAECAAALEAFYDALEAFPRQKWESRRAAYLARVRARMTSAPPAARPRVFRLMPHANFRLAAQSRPEAASSWEEGAAEDGSLWWTIEQDPEGDLTVRAGGPGHAQTRVRLRAGAWVQERALTAVPEAPDQVGAVFRLGRDDRAALPPYTPLELHILGPEPDPAGRAEAAPGA